MIKLLTALALLPVASFASSPLPAEPCDTLTHSMKYQWELAVHMADFRGYHDIKINCEKVDANFQPILDQYHRLLAVCQAGQTVHTDALDIPVFSPSTPYLVCNGTDMPEILQKYFKNS